MLYDVDEERITRPVIAPLCVSIDSPAPRDWATWAIEEGFLLRNLSVVAAQSLVRAWRPLLVLVAQSTFEQHREAIVDTVGWAGSTLLVLDAAAKRGDVHHALRRVRGFRASA